MELNKKLLVKGKIEFNTAFHIGSGSTGDQASDMGIMTDFNGKPIIPGSSLKGVFRSAAEALAGHLKLHTCFLNRDGAIDGTDKICEGNVKTADKALKAIDNAQSKEKIQNILDNRLCDTCKLFGSVLARGKLRFKDGEVKKWAGALEIRDGVSIDRDSGTAVDKAKYDYEVVPSGATFYFEMHGENLNKAEEALVFAVLREWEMGFHLGGMTSRGFGSAKLKNMEVRTVNLKKRDQLIDYLLKRKMKEIKTKEIDKKIKKVIKEN